MLHSTHYNLNLAEGTDLVNPLTVDVPNYQTIDGAMFANEQAGVGSATELKSGTIHTITRANANRNVFRFKSTSVFLAGDTFTVDGATVTALYPDGSSLKDRCFIIGSDVLCLLDGAQLTVLATYYPDAQNVPFDDTNVPYVATNVQTAIDNASTASGTKYSSGVSVKDKIDEVDKIRIISGNLPSNVTSTPVGQNIDLLSVNENLGRDYAVLAVNVYVFGQNRSLMNKFEETAILSGNISTITGIGLLKALTNSQYNNASVTIILCKLT